MKITKTQLKQIIQEVIQEEHPVGADRNLAYLMDNYLSWSLKTFPNSRSALNSITTTS